ncbi:MAG TPA: phosphomannomutase/phosphoglucomutase [Candidatus Ornithospirochaeta stercorigallinarum]|nr:phosphomannomutase/phosphoglucomutase [Candidatus Ornithospirochaeta stercorigallinarum]
MGAFKAYDIRGIYNKDFDKETAYKVGYFLPSLLSTDHVVVGRDVRLSSPEIHEYLLKGITDSGADVYDLGLATTPMVYFATVFLKADASVQITASHNPKEYNGLKISRKDAIPVGGDTGLKDLEKLCNEGEITISEKKGEVKDYSYVRDEYVKYLRGFCPDIEDLDISIDCSNGMSSLIIKDVLKDDSIHYIYDTFDGSFPNHEPNPLDERNCEDIKRETLKNRSDVGIIYDGDADRVMFIDEKGRFIQPDYITAVLGCYYKKKGLSGNSLVDVRTSRSTTEYLESIGFPPTLWKVGHAFAKMKIREIDAVFGGELAGHYYFRRDFFNCDSGILASLLVLSVVKSLKEEGRTLSQLIDSIVKYSNTGEVNFKLEEKDECISRILEHFKSENPSKILSFDGYRIEFPSWWFSIRKSNTEPYLRIVLEAQSKEEMENRLKEIKDIIGQFK